MGTNTLGAAALHCWFMEMCQSKVSQSVRDTLFFFQGPREVSAMLECYLDLEGKYAFAPADVGGFVY